MDEIIYIPLENKGTPMQRPTPASRRNNGTYVVLRPENYDPSAEAWRFPPGTIVECEWVTENGKKRLTAVRVASVAGRAKGSKSRPPPLPQDDRRKISYLTVILAISYLVLTICCWNGTFLDPLEVARPGLAGVLFLPLIMIGGPILIWLTFFVQLTLLNTLARRMRFGWNVLVSVFVGPIAALMILRVLFLLWALFS